MHIYHIKNDTYQLSKYNRILKITKILKLRNKSNKKKKKIEFHSSISFTKFFQQPIQKFSHNRAELTLHFFEIKDLKFG
jgi:hypothetical protein